MNLCEYLPRLNQISITVDTPQNNNAVKSFCFSENKLFLETATKSDGSNTENAPDSMWSNIAHHEIILPIEDPSELTGAKITNFNKKDDVVSITLTLNNYITKSAPTPFTGLPNSNGIWSVEDLLKKTPKNSSNTSEFKFTCGVCDNVIVDSKTHKFVDMPSEYWHELMDFWHCHKPHEDHHNIGINSKNYEGKLNPKPGFVHVGTSYILLPLKPENCGTCGGNLGTLEGETLRVHKWNLHLQYGDEVEEYQPYYLVYFAILDRVNSSGVRKFTVKSTNSSLSYNIWVISVGLNVSYNHQISRDVLKLLYTEQENSPDDDLIEVPNEVGVSLKKYFTEKNLLLPKSLQKLDLRDGDIMRRYNLCYLSPREDSF